MVQRVHGFQVRRLQAMAGVDQQIGPHQVRAAAQIGAAQVLELARGGLGGLGEAIAGQVGQSQPAIHIEQVHLAGAPGLVGRPRQVLAPDQGVDQRGLADVGAAGEGHLRHAGVGQLVDLGRPHHEVGRPREQHAGELQGLGGEGVLGHRASPSPTPGACAPAPGR